MSPAFYLRYTLRSLARGGTRTILAIFCIGVGVMAIVALQLAGLTIGHAFTDDVRAINHGDISVQSDNIPLAERDLEYFKTLASNSEISSWTAVNAPAMASGRRGDQQRPVNYLGVDPSLYPLAGQVKLEQPTGGNFRDLLTVKGNAIVGSVARELLGARIGDRIHLTSPDASFDVTVVGTLPATGWESAFNILVSLETARAGATQPVTYAAVYMNTPDHAKMLATAAEVRKRFPLATVNTTDDVVKSREEATKQLQSFLQIAGLLALLVGGIGVVNTMQVLLSRRRIEIAMLKTAGYRRRDLYYLFGLEAAWLGLAGGLTGALMGLGLSFGVIKLVQGILLQDLALIINPLVVLSGIVIGLATALIFGLLPIVRAAAIRPLAVIRELPESGWRSRLQSAGLLLLLAILFTAFATVILGDAKFAAIAVGSALAGLGLLTLLFGLIAFGVSKLPVPERPSPRYLLVAIPVILAAAAVTLALPSVGIVLTLVVVMAAAVVLLPRTWKSTTKLAYRGIGRQAGRTATTLVALFVGVFTVGLILIIGQDLRSRFDELVSRSLSYSVAAVDLYSRAYLIDQALPRVSGLHGERRNTLAAVIPSAINGESVSDFVARMPKRSGFDAPQFWLLASLEGSNLGGGQVPKAPLPKKPHPGRALRASDAGTNNIVAGDQLMDKPWNFKPGDTITLGAPGSSASRTVTIVGFFANQPGEEIHNGNLLGDDSLVTGLAGAGTRQIWLLNVDPANRAQAFRVLTDADPQASMVDFTDFVVFFDKLISNVIVFLSAIASLALLAGIVIIANAVALAMLERRREIGILKAVGYESRTVLAQVLLENAIVGALGGIAAISVVAVAINLLGRFLFKIELSVGTPLALTIIVATAVLAALTAALVAWGPSRIRPLEILRYE